MLYHKCDIFTNILFFVPRGSDIFEYVLTLSLALMSALLMPVQIHYMYALINNKKFLTIVIFVISFSLSILSLGTRSVFSV